MRRTIAAFGLVLGVAGGAIVSAIPSVESEAASAASQTFVIPSDDGYGIADCASTGSASCGQVVADAWCEAQGFSRSSSFGPAEVDVTGSITTSARPLSVTCAN